MMQPVRVTGSRPPHGACGYDEASSGEVDGLAAHGFELTDEQVGCPEGRDGLGADRGLVVAGAEVPSASVDGVPHASATRLKSKAIAAHLRGAKGFDDMPQQYLS